MYLFQIVPSVFVKLSFQISSVPFQLIFGGIYVLIGEREKNGMVYKNLLLAPSLEGLFPM